MEKNKTHEEETRKLRVVIAKGRIFQNIAQLLHDVGIDVRANERDYRPIVNNLDIEINS